jgi:hypothetical protein
MPASGERGDGGGAAAADGLALLIMLSLPLSRPGSITQRQDTHITSFLAPTESD